MIQHHGVWYPDYDESFHCFHPEELARDIPFFLGQVPGRTCVVQAGGAMGLYPVTLAQHFQHVLTCEPDPLNWECLQANLKARDCLGRVTAMNVGLGEAAGLGHMARPEPWNCGANRVIACDAGPVTLTTIDAIAKDTPVDAIWLDVEGSELFALKGAIETINRCSPLIVTEENGNGDKYGVDQFGIADFLETLGYSVECGIGNDRYYRRSA